MRIMLYTDPIVLREPPTAYAKVGYALYSILKQKHEIAHTPMTRANGFGIWRMGDLMIYPSGATPFAEDVIADNCYHFGADMVLVLKDLYAFEKLHTLPLECMYYVPVDHEDVNPSIVYRLKTAYKVIAMTEFGRDELEKKGIKVDAVIPHGYDPSIYKPPESKEKCKSFFKIPPNKFVVGVIARNQVRKDIPSALQVIKRCHEEYDDIVGLLWSDLNKEVPLMNAIHQLGLKDVVYTPDRVLYEMGLKENMMPTLYGAMDVLIGCGCEGFWLPAIEAAACGVPTVHVDYAGGGENAQFRAPVARWTWNNQVGVKQPLVNVNIMADFAIGLYEGGWQRDSERQIEWASSYTWDKIAPKWLELVESCEEELVPVIKR